MSFPTTVIHSSRSIRPLYDWRRLTMAPPLGPKIQSSHHLLAFSLLFGNRNQRAASLAPRAWRKIEDRGSRIEDRRSRIVSLAGLLSTILDPRSSILDPRSRVF